MNRRHLLGASMAVATGATVAGTLGQSSKKTTQNPRQTARQTQGPSQNHAPAKSDLSAPSISRNRRQLRIATSWPKDFPGLGIMPNRFANSVREMTDGIIDIKVYAAGELVGATECFDAVSSGAADMYHAAEYYWQGKSKGFSFFTAVPMGMTSDEIMGWIEFGGGQALWDDLSARFNIKAFQAGNTGHQTGGWFKKKIETLEDFKGLRMRMPGLGGEVIRRLGGAAVRLSGGEIYQALQSGAIDATEWVGPWNDLAFGFYREAPYYYAPGFHEPGASLAVGINLDVWSQFSSDEKAIIKYACASANNASLGEYTYQNGLALERLKREHEIYPQFFTDEIMTTIGQISEDVVADLGTSDPVTTKIYESYLKARNAQRGWTEMGNGRYVNARRAALNAQ